ncbi:MAG: right-handed parallel beta-helix repeat-containing protein [Planctomycetota bacterium]
MTKRGWFAGWVVLLLAWPAAGGTTRTVAVGTRAAIQTAIDASSAGDTVELPGHLDYVLDGPLRAKSGVAIEGAGMGQTVLRAAGGHDRFFDLAGTRDVTLRGFTMDGVGSGLSYGVVASNGGGHRLERVEVTRLSGTAFGPLGVYFSSGVTDSVITGSRFSEIGVDSTFGGGIRIAHGSVRNTVVGNKVKNTGRGGIFFNDDSGQAVVRGNTVTGSGLRSQGLGIELHTGVDGSVVEDNRVDSWLSVDGSDRVAVRRNVIGGVPGAGFKFAGLELVDVNRVVLADNRVDGNADVGLSLSGQGVTESVIVARNQVGGANSFSAQLQGDDGDDGDGALRGVLLLQNTLSDAVGGDGFVGSGFGDGLRVNDNVQDLLAVGNKLTGHAGRGITLTGDNERLRFVGNTVHENQKDAFDPVQVSGLPADLQWLGNDVADNGSDAQPVSQGFASGVPELSLDAIGDVVAGQPIRLSVTAGAGFAPQTVLWDLGYGVPVLGSSVEVVFPKADEYTVTVLAYGDAGVAYDTRTITVIPEPGALGLVGVGGLLAWAVVGRGRRRSMHRA